MAGGIGSRFWPMSTPDHPKQFLDVLGIGKSLIRMTYERLLHVAPADQIYVLTNVDYKDLVLDHIPEMKAEQVLTEPVRKNTAPGVAYVAAKINQINPNATLIISAADHLIMKEQRFSEIIQIAVNDAQNDKLVTLGIKPSRPDTGYGYIEFDASQKGNAGGVTPVLQFREKPNLATAEEFVAKGNFYWNSGIFVWKTSTVLTALEQHSNDLFQLFTKNLTAYNSSSEQAFINEAFHACEDIAVDYAIMEKANNIDVVLADFDWSDLGTWGSLNDHLSKDAKNNAVIGKNIHLFDSQNCIVNVSDDKLVVLDGLENYIVIESNNRFLVLRKENEQALKNILKEVEKKSGEFF